MEGFLAFIPDIIKILGLLVSAFAILATMTANESDNAVADKMLKGINILAGNFGKSKNGNFGKSKNK